MKGTNAVAGPWELPASWTWERIEAVAPVNPKRPFPTSDDHTLVPFVPMAAVAEEAGSVALDQRRPAGEVRKGFTRFRSGDVIFAKITPCMENGKVALLPELDGGWGAGSTEFHVLSPDHVDGRYLFYWLVQKAFRQGAEFNMTGTAGQKRVPPDYLRNALISVPPLDTQRRIVARVDELFSDLDDGEEELARARADLATYRKSLLKAAVTGELTTDWRAAHPPTESGADLLARILADRKARWTADPRNTGRRHAEAAGPDAYADADLPNGWAWASIEQLTTGGIRNGLSLKESSEPTKVKGLRLDALQPGGIVWERTRYLPISIERAAPYRLRSGDLLISRANGSPDLVGRCSLITDSRDDTIFPDTAIRYPLWGEEVFHRWVSMAWSAPQTRTRMLASAKTTAGILKISQIDIAAVPLPLPPLAEFREIVRRYDATLAEVEAGWLEMQPLASASATLRQSVLAAAFRGELVS